MPRQWPPLPAWTFADKFARKRIFNDRSRHSRLWIASVSIRSFLFWLLMSDSFDLQFRFFSMLWIALSFNDVSWWAFFDLERSLPLALMTYHFLYDFLNIVPVDGTWIWIWNRVESVFIVLNEASTNLTRKQAVRRCDAEMGLVEMARFVSRGEKDTVGGRNVLC